ncbi:hypothetical protein EKH55_4099 [Sinorhizobium alkalisoli]|nr:hypothetical protein EKH55_4099 [Sinorhizobium alkalisoli]
MKLRIRHFRQNVGGTVRSLTGRALKRDMPGQPFAKGWASRCASTAVAERNYS